MRNTENMATALLLLAWTAINVAEAEVSTGPIQKLPAGTLQAHYDSSCDAVVMIHVGTAMRVTNYKDLGKSIVQESPASVAIIIDDNPKSIKKQDGQKYTNLVNAIYKDITNLVPSCSQQSKYYLIGGHSGGGQGAAEALKMDELDFTPSGFVGLAPYDMLNLSIARIPSLNVGFSRMSCLVAPKKEALAAYLASNESHRIFYRVQTHNWNILTGGPHCSFADSGCLGMCAGERKMSDWMHRFVGRVVNLFVKAIVSDTYDHNHFQVHTGNYKVDLFVNSETPPTSKEKAVGAPSNPVWPDRWSAQLYAKSWRNLGWRRSKNLCSYHYDWTNGQSLVQLGFGQTENWCGCATTEAGNCRIYSYSADHPNNYQGQPATYVHAGDVCCMLYVGVGPLNPDWLSSPAIQYSGEKKAGYPKRLCNRWENTNPGKKIILGGSWLIDSDNVPCGFMDVFKWWDRLLGLGHYFTFDASTYKLSVEDDVFELPLNCQLACPHRNDKSKPWCHDIFSG